MIRTLYNIRLSPEIPLRSPPFADAGQRVPMPIKFPQEGSPDNKTRGESIANKGESIANLSSTELATYWLSAIIESADDAIITKTLEGIITSWNPGAERIFGYTAAEIIGKPVTVLIPVDHPNEEPAILARLRAGKRID